MYLLQTAKLHPLILLVIFVPKQKDYLDWLVPTTPTLLLLCRCHLVGKMDINISVAHHDPHSPVELGQVTSN